MSRNEARFGGEIGAILVSTFHITSFLFGALMVGLLAGTIALFTAVGLGELVPFIAQMWVFLFVIRTARSTAHTGQLDSPWRAPGTTWPDDVAALARMVGLNMLWVIPLSIWQPNPANMASLGPLTVFAILATLGLPPFFLIAAVGSDRVHDLIDPDYWRGVFGGRGSELLTLLSAYLGGGWLTIGSGLLLAFALGSSKGALLIGLLLVAGSFGLGATMLLMGRLVGMFLSRDSSAHVEFLPEVDDSPTDEAPIPAAPQRLRDGTEVEEGVNIDGLYNGAQQDGAFHVDEPAPAPTQEATPQQVVMAPSPGSQIPVTEFLRSVERRAESDPAKALEELEEWATAHRAPHPLVSSRRAVLQKKLNLPEALDTAQRAIEQARGASSVGAMNEIYDSFQKQEAELGLTADDWQKMAAAKTSMGKDAQAVTLYGKVLAERPDAMPSIKGLIQIADNYLKLEDGAERALVIYDLLDRRCPDHPFGDFVDRGREQASRRLQKTR